MEYKIQDMMHIDSRVFRQNIAAMVSALQIGDTVIGIEEPDSENPVDVIIESIEIDEMPKAFIVKDVDNDVTYCWNETGLRRLEDVN